MRNGSEIDFSALLEMLGNLLILQGSGGPKSKSGFANPVFNTAFYQIVFGFGLYLRLHNQNVFGFRLYQLSIDSDSDSNSNKNWNPVFGKGRDMETMPHSDFKCLIRKCLTETMSHYIFSTWRHFHV